jgi:hypothetical protein
MKLIFYFFFFYFIFINKSYAYLDPGTGSIILQAIIAGATAFFAYIVFYYRKIKSFLKNFFNKNSNKK